MIELFTSMYGQCLIGDKPTPVVKEEVRIVEVIKIVEVPVEVFVEPQKEPEPTPVYHIPSRIQTIKSFTYGDYKKSIFHPDHPRAIKTNHKELQ